MLRTKLLTAALMVAIFATPAWAGSTSTSSADSSSKSTSTSTATLDASISVSNQTSIQSGNQHQPGGIAVPSPSAGYCGGISGGFAVGFAGASFGASVGTIEKACAQDRHIGVGMSDPVTRPKAEELWFSMNPDMFGTQANGPTGQQQGSTSATPAAITPEQTASATPRCANDNTPPATKIALGCQ